MTSTEFREQEILEFLQSQTMDTRDKGSRDKTTAEEYIMKRNLVSYEDCKHRLGLDNDGH